MMDRVIKPNADFSVIMTNTAENLLILKKNSLNCSYKYDYCF